jgi:hypothetical protein
MEKTTELPPPFTTAVKRDESAGVRQGTSESWNEKAKRRDTEKSTGFQLSTFSSLVVIEKTLGRGQVVW